MGDYKIYTGFIPLPEEVKKLIANKAPERAKPDTIDAHSNFDDLEA